MFLTDKPHQPLQVNHCVSVCLIRLRDKLVLLDVETKGNDCNQHKSQIICLCICDLQ